jgi:hypothetical protein
MGHLQTIHRLSGILRHFHGCYEGLTQVVLAALLPDGGGGQWGFYCAAQERERHQQKRSHGMYRHEIAHGATD